MPSGVVPCNNFKAVVVGRWPELDSFSGWHVGIRSPRRIGAPGSFVSRRCGQGLQKIRWLSEPLDSIASGRYEVGHHTGLNR